MHQYNTVALTNYWGFKWLDRTGLNSFWIAVCLFVIILPLFFLAEFLAVNYGDNNFPQELNYVFASMLSIFVTCWIVLARGAQSDFLIMEKTGLLTPDSDPNELIEPRKAVRLLELVAGTVLGVGMYNLGRATVNEISQFESLIDTIAELRLWYSVPHNLLSWFVFAVIGVSIVRLTSFLWRQVRVYLNIAERLDIDILQTETLAVFANQPLRTLVGTIVLVSGSLALSNAEGRLRGHLLQYWHSAPNRNADGYGSGEPACLAHTATGRCRKTS